MSRSPCPIASTLDLIGDRWTLVILRDLLNGKTRYAQFLDLPEKITTNVLAVRLKQMEADGLVTKAPYQLWPARFDYALTEKGRTLHPVLQQICLWGNRHLPGTWIPPARFMEGAVAAQVAVAAVSAQPAAPATGAGGPASGGRSGAGT